MLKDVLRSLRESKRLSQADVAKNIGVSPAAYSTYETGTRDVSSDKIVKLAKFYGVTTDYLYEIEDLSSYDFNLNEKQLIKKYRTLDEYGKKTVDSALDIQYERCSFEQPVITKSESNIVGRMVAFGGESTEVTMTDEEFRQAIKTLKKYQEKEE
ncbi:MAG: helix-turn-helix domain-containing protein [Ruminococcus sp.]|nr:helix-turn-helix domain-containing protein [Ruminococcus sp.]